MDDEQTPAPPAPTRTRLRDRTFRLRAVAAVGLASLILGGLGGAAIGVVADGDDHHPARPGGPGGRFQPGPPDGGLPPGTAPDDQEAEPEQSGTGA